MKLILKPIRRAYLYHTGSIFHNFDKEDNKTAEYAYFRGTNELTGKERFGFAQKIHNEDRIEEIPMPSKKL